eukprot:7389643-Prymnesium_polylepis.4
MGQPPSDGIACNYTADCPTSGACAENPVCWKHAGSEGPNGQHFCAEQVTPGSFGTTADICNAPNAPDYVQCHQAWRSATAGTATLALLQWWRSATAVVAQVVAQAGRASPLGGLQVAVQPCSWY